MFPLLWWTHILGYKSSIQSVRATSSCRCVLVNIGWIDLEDFENAGSRSHPRKDISLAETTCIWKFLCHIEQPQAVQPRWHVYYK